MKHHSTDNKYINQKNQQDRQTKGCDVLLM